MLPRPVYYVRYIKSRTYLAVQTHHKFVHRALRRRVIVPHPKRDLPAGTVHAIYRDAGWQKD
ncbi:MAG: type II toxin-antitoxin system HicA family toxin [Rhizobiales bacterium]|nr:type II toxin-antitoxin system HicA family toxin [Hyphomicrobiales bacterium]